MQVPKLWCCVVGSLSRESRKQKRKYTDRIISDDQKCYWGEAVD